MPLSIRNPEVEKLARALAERSGLGITEAIGEALEARLGSLDAGVERRLAAMTKIADACAAAPDFDSRSPEAILGYDQIGAFGVAEGGKTARW